MRPREGDHVLLGGELGGGPGKSLHRRAGREDDHGFGLLVRLVANGVLEPRADWDHGAGPGDRARDGPVLAFEVDRLIAKGGGGT